MIHEFEVGLRRYPVGMADEKWFPVWLRRYAEFLNRTCEEKLPVDSSLAKKFSRELLKNSVPAWQRLRAVRTLVAYRRIVWES